MRGVSTTVVLLFVLVSLLAVFNTPSIYAVAQESAEAEAPAGIVMEGLTVDDEKAIETNKESFVFQAEVNRLMDIIINSLYKNKEVFLRELISNASDALDKLRFLALTASDMLGETKDLAIKVSFNDKLKTLTIRDTGIGMTRNELINNLGTLAKSGTKKFLESLSEGADIGLIGQFGVGFYSVYLVADRVRVVTKNNDDDQYIWESTADSSFSIVKDPRGNTLESDEEEEKKVEKKTEKVESWDWHLMNGNVAIWSRDKDEITDEEYQKFFRVISKDPTDAASWIHFKAEGEVEFKSILYVPAEALNLYDEYSNRKPGIRLYVKKVLIQDDFEDLLPKYLNFIRGVLDSDDLPLNVSRETLQQHKLLKIMGKKLVRKVLEMLRKLSLGKQDKDSDEESESKNEIYQDNSHPYIKFFEQFGKSLKMGVVEDAANRSKLAKLLRFQSSKSEGKYTSFDSYLETKPEWQKDIYYLAAESIEAAEKSPFMEVARRKGIEVLFLIDPIDEYAIQNLGDYDGHKLQSLTKEGLKFGDEDEDTLKKRTKAYRENFKPLTKFLKELLAGKVSKVTVSQRVESSPSVIVTSQYGHTANMERIMRAQTFANPEVLKSMMAAKTLELNPRHPIIVELNKRVKQSPEDETTKTLAHLVYDTALLASGFTHDNVDDFTTRMYQVLGSELNLKSLELEEELQFEEEEEEEEEDAGSAKDEF
eukprot:gene11965-8542_t